MVLKPSPRVAALLEERITEVLQDDSLEYPDHMALKEFRQDLERYLN